MGKKNSKSVKEIDKQIQSWYDANDSKFISAPLINIIASIWFTWHDKESKEKSIIDFICELRERGFNAKYKIEKSKIKGIFEIKQKLPDKTFNFLFSNEISRENCIFGYQITEKIINEMIEKII